MNPYEDTQILRQDFLTGKESISTLIRKGWRVYKRTRTHYDNTCRKEFYIASRYPNYVFVHKSLEDLDCPYYELALKYKENVKIL